MATDRTETYRCCILGRAVHAVDGQKWMGMGMQTTSMRRGGQEQEATTREKRADANMRIQLTHTTPEPANQQSLCCLVHDLLTADLSLFFLCFFFFSVCLGSSSTDLLLLLYCFFFFFFFIVSIGGSNQMTADLVGTDFRWSI